MTDKRDDQNFDDWFAANFAENKTTPPKPQDPPVAPPVVPDYTATPGTPPQFSPPPVTFDPALAPQPPVPQTPPPPAQPAVPPPAAPQPPTFDPSLVGQDAVATEFIPQPPPFPTAEAGSGNALDALFGEEKFRDYEEEPDPTFTHDSTTPEGSVKEPPEGISRLHLSMMWVAGSAVAVLALVAFFLVGTKLPMLTGANESDQTVEPTAPAPAERPVGPVAPGTYNWNELLGGECLEEFRGAWENEYTVVDCATPHAAQLVTRAAVPVAAGTGGVYPGVFDLQSRMNLLCTDAAVIDYEAAKNFNDIQFESSFPPSSEEWDAGRRDYFCFVSRASGEPIEGNLAAPPAPDEPAEEDITGDDGS